MTTRIEDVNSLEEVNDGVERIYGQQLSQEEARHKADVHMEQRNLDIHTANRNQDWCPEIRWPELGTPEAAEVTDEYRTLLCRRWTRSNRITPDDHGRIFSDRHYVSWLRNWEKYLKRPDAGKELEKAAIPLGQWLIQLFERIAVFEGQYPSPQMLAQAQELIEKALLQQTEIEDHEKDQDDQKDT